MIESKRSRGEPTRASVAEKWCRECTDEDIPGRLISASSPQNESN